MEADERPDERLHDRSQRLQDHLTFSQQFGQRISSLLSVEGTQHTTSSVGAGTTAIEALCPECGSCTSQPVCGRCGASMVEALEAWRAAGVHPPPAISDSARATEEALKAAMGRLAVLTESTRVAGPGQAVTLRARSEQLRLAAEMLERGEVDEAIKLLTELEQDVSVSISGRSLHHEVDDHQAAVQADSDDFARASARVRSPIIGERAGRAASPPAARGASPASRAVPLPAVAAEDWVSDRTISHPF